MLSPFAKIDGLCFNNEVEPSDFYYLLTKDTTKDQLKHSDGVNITIEANSPKELYGALYDIENYTNDHVKAWGTSIDEELQIVINEESDMDDVNAASTIALQKKRKKPQAVKVE